MQIKWRQIVRTFFVLLASLVVLYFLMTIIALLAVPWLIARLVGGL